MNLEQSNAFRDMEIKNDRRKKLIGIMFILCIIAIVILLLLIQQIKKVDAATLKFYIDGEQKKISQTLFYNENGINYINVKELCNFLGISYTVGQYGKFNEAGDSCYINNDFEITAMTVGQNEFQKISEGPVKNDTLGKLKVTTKSKKGDSATFVAEVAPISVQDQIYVPFSSLRDMFSLSIDNSNAKRIKFYTLGYLYETYASEVNKNGYMLKGDYENIKTLLYDLAVVRAAGEENEQNATYGVISIANGNAEVKIGLKYDDITFLQNTINFIIKSGNTVGVLNQDGGDVIKPDEYDEISIYDDTHMLYRVKKDGKYGIVDKVGKTVMYPDFDEVGFEARKDFEYPEGTGNYKILFDKAIVVRENGKYGLRSIDGEELLGSNYDDFGCDPDTARFTTGKVTNEKAVVTIPESVGIHGLVINKDGLYGIYDMAGTDPRIIVPTSCQKIYSITKSGETKYYIEYVGQTIDLEEFLIQENLVSVGSGVKKSAPLTSTTQEQQPTEENNNNNNNNNENNNEGNDNGGGEQVQEQSQEGGNQGDETVVVVE